MTDERMHEQFEFLRKAENLKNTLRSAHTSAGRRESSAEHTWRLCLMILTFENDLDGLDTVKLLKLAVIHDLAEAVYGDIPATEQDDGSDKLELEQRAMNELLSTAPPDVRSTFFELWEEYEDMRSAEAKFLKGLDKLETILQHNQGINAADFDYDLIFPMTGNTWTHIRYWPKCDPCLTSPPRAGQRETPLSISETNNVAVTK